MTVRAVIGVDCSTSPRKVGLSLAILGAEGDASVEATRVCSKLESPAEVLAGWLDERPDALLALDAPLGWPAPLGDSLAHHFAGEPIEAARHLVFDRETDRVVHQRYGVKPLSVGADRIGRTAHSALELLATLRGRTGHALPLAWGPQPEVLPAVIEVYPAATLAALGLPSKGDGKRSRAVGRLDEELRLGDEVVLSELTPDEFDSLICLLAGLDFLAGNACSPIELTDLVRREGWIWVRPPDNTRAG